MLIYIAVIALTTILAWLYTKTPTASRKILFALMVLIPSLLAGLRGIGTDYLLYQLRFDELIAGTYQVTDFSLIYVLMRVFAFIGLGYQSFTLLIAFATTSITFFVFCRYEKKINLTIAVFSYMTSFYLMGFNIFRQMLATAILMLAFYFLLEKQKKFLFWLLSILVFLIHSAVALFSLFYFILPMIQEPLMYRKRRLIVYLVMTGFIMILPLLSGVLSIFAQYFPHYAYYFLNFEYTGIGLGILRYLILCIIPLFCISYINGSFSYAHDRTTHPYLVLCVLGTILWLTSYISTSYIYRVGYIGLAWLPIIHGSLWKNISEKEPEQTFCKIAMQCIIVVFLIFFCWFDFIHNNSGSVNPFSFYWQI